MTRSHLSLCPHSQVGSALVRTTVIQHQLQNFRVILCIIGQRVELPCLWPLTRRFCLTLVFYLLGRHTGAEEQGVSLYRNPTVCQALHPSLIYKVTINTFVYTEDKIRTGKKEKKILIESRNNKEAKRFFR